MKFFTYLLSIISIIALTGLFIFKQPNGQAWLSVNSFIPNTQRMDEAINLARKKLHQLFESDLSENEGAIKVYRWKDSNGHWNYSDNPKVSTKNEEVFFNPKDILVLPTFNTPSVDLSNSKEKYDNTEPKALGTSPSKVLELYQDVNNVQKLMDARQDNISKAIKENT